MTLGQLKIVIRAKIIWGQDQAVDIAIVLFR